MIDFKNSGFIFTEEATKYIVENELYKEVEFIIKNYDKIQNKIKKQIKGKYPYYTKNNWNFNGKECYIFSSHTKIILKVKSKKATFYLDDKIFIL